MLDAEVPQQAACGRGAYVWKWRGAAARVHAWYGRRGVDNAVNEADEWWKGFLLSEEGREDVLSGGNGNGREQWRSVSFLIDTGSECMLMVI